MRNLSYMTRKDSATGERLLPEGKRKVFISYKHSDEEQLPLCQTLAECILERLDVAIWYDHELTAGKEYDEEIQRAITQSDAFVLLLTPNIVSSKYVLEQEIPYAIKQQVAVIPIIAGISEKELPKIEAIVGRVHMPLWFFDEHQQAPDFQKDAKEQLFSGLQLAIANKDLLEQAKLFYEKGYHNVSMRYLTPEQVFAKAYGVLFGVDSDTEKSVGIRLMESILGLYGDDREFADLQEQVAYELLSHFCRTDQPELFISYMKSSMEKGYKKAIPLLFHMYSNQWHSELWRYETELSLKMTEELFRTNFNHSLDVEDLIENKAKKCELSTSSDPVSDLPHIGELLFFNHIAFFQKSSTEDRTVNLIIDGRCVAQYDVYASYGDAYFLYMGYDEEHNALIVLYSDFDHYGPETYTRAEFYVIKDGLTEKYTFGSEWIKGRKQLPYSPYTFNIKNT